MQRFLIFLAVIFEVSRFLLTNLLHLGSIIELISLFFKYRFICFVSDTMDTAMN